jgi:hypothetical protein
MIIRFCTNSPGGKVQCSFHLIETNCTSGGEGWPLSQYASLQINSAHVCYVNPKDSSEALYGEDQSFLLPLLFFGIGATFIVLGGPVPNS